MVMSTGTIRPSLACAWVAALNSLQKPMMFTPCWPSAGPTGGEGFAFPAGSCSLTIPVTFFIASSPMLRPFGLRPAGGGPASLHCVVRTACRLRSRLLHLHEVQLDGRGAAEDRDQHPHAPLVGVHFLHRAVEVRERSVHHAHVVAFLELHFRLRLQRSLGELGREPRDLVLADRGRLGGVADESGDLRRVLHQVPGAVVQLHLDEDIAGEELALRGALLPLHHLDHVLHRDEDVPEELLERVLLDLLLEALLGLVLEARVRVDHVPFLVDLGRSHVGHLLYRLGFWILSVRNCHNTSNIPSRAAAMMLATITATVAARVSGRLGQLTLRSSATMSSATSRVLGVTQT